MLLTAAPKRGRKAAYASSHESEQAKVARRKQRRQEQRALSRDAQFSNVFTLAPPPMPSPWNPFQAIHINPIGPVEPQPLAYDDEFVLLQIDDEFGDLLLVENPLPSPSLGSVPMDISDSELGEPNQDTPELEPGSDAEEDAGFEDIDELVPDVEEGHEENEDVERQTTRLVTQLLQFQGCCADCHRQVDQEHADDHETHCGLQTVVTKYADGIPGYPDILVTRRVARYEDDLAGSMTAEQKRWIFTGIHPDNINQTRQHVCLHEGDTPCQTAQVSWDTDSLIGYVTSPAVAKGGMLWNPIQRPVSDLHSSGHLAQRQVHYTDSHGHVHCVLMPVHKMPHYTFGRFVGLDAISMYFLFPRLYRENQQNSQLLEDDYEVWLDRVILPAVYKHCRSSQVQHLPSSFQHAKYHSTARGVEGRSHKVSEAARVQLFQHAVQPEQLHRIWAVRISIKAIRHRLIIANYR